MWLAIVAALGLITFAFGAGTFMIRNKEFEPLRVLFFFLFVLHIFLLMLTCVMISFNPDNSGSFSTLGTTYFSIMVIVLIFFIWEYGTTMLGRMFNNKNKEEED